MRKATSRSWCVSALMMSFVLVPSPARSQERPNYDCRFDKAEIERVGQVAEDLKKGIELTEEERALLECYTLRAKPQSLKEGNPAVGARDLPPFGSSYGPPSSFNGYFELLKESWVLFKDVWGFLKENRPVSIADLPFTAVLPTGVKNWDEMERWKMPRRSAYYGYSYKNLLGMEVVRFKYAIQYTPGGQYNGRGRYLNNVVVVWKDVRVLSGFKFTLESKVPNLLNFGTKADPIAGLQLNLNWNVESILTSLPDSQTFVIGGDGRFGEIGTNQAGIVPANSYQSYKTKRVRVDK
jgi:hypothetical protein